MGICLYFCIKSKSRSQQKRCRRIRWTSSTTSRIKYCFI